MDVDCQRQTRICTNIKTNKLLSWELESESTTIASHHQTFNFNFDSFKPQVILMSGHHQQTFWLAFSLLSATELQYVWRKALRKTSHWSTVSTHPWNLCIPTSTSYEFEYKDGGRGFSSLELDIPCSKIECLVYLSFRRRILMDGCLRR